MDFRPRWLMGMGQSQVSPNVHQNYGSVHGHPKPCVTDETKIGDPAMDAVLPSAIIASRTNDAGQNGVESHIEDLGATGDVWNDQSARKDSGAMKVRVADSQGL